MVKQKYLYVLLLLLGVALSVYVALSPLETMLRWFNVDDGFFYFKVARNFNQGLGFTFDGINRGNGFHPLWMAVCVFIYRIFPADLVLPLRAIVLVAGVMNGFAAILFYKVLERPLGQVIAFVMAGVWAVWPAIYKVTTTQGMETGLSVLLLLLLIERAQAWFIFGRKTGAGCYLLFGFIALLATLARLDHVFYVGMICLFVVLKIQFRDRLLVFDIVGISVSVVLSYLLTYQFGVVNFSNHTIFPLLFLSLLTKTLILWLAGCYQDRRIRSFPDGMKKLVWLVAANVALVPVLYLINALQGPVRFSKLVILLELFFSTAWIIVNHLVHGLRSPGEVATRGRFYRPEKRVLLNALYTMLPVLAGIGAYLAFNLSFFSTLLPVSGRVKHFWAGLDNPVYGRARNFFDVFGIGARVNPWRSETNGLLALTNGFLYRTGAYSPHTSAVVFSLVLMGLLLLLFFMLAAARGRVLWKMNSLLLPALFIGSLFRVGFYAMYGYIGIRNWYWIVERLILFLFISVLLHLGLEKLGKRMLTRSALVLVLCGLLVYSFSQHLLYAYRNFYLPSTRTGGQSNLAGTRFLEQNTREGAIIGMTGGGMEGYFIRERTIVNMDGLINSESYFKSLKEGRAADFLADMGLDYVYGNSYMLTVSDPYAEMFYGKLQFLGGIDEEIALYEFDP